MKNKREFDRDIVIDCYVQHPQKYTRTFWIGFFMLGGYKLIVVVALIVLWALWS